MSFLVLADGSPVWKAPCLDSAMAFAERYVDEGRYVEIITRQSSELHTFRFDHDRRLWLESVLKRAREPREPNATLKLAA